MLTTTSKQISWHDSIVYEAKISGKFIELIQGIYRRQIISEQALAVGIKLTEQEVQLAADRLRIANQLETAEATLAWLQAHFLSVTDLEQIVTHQLLTEKLAHYLFAERVEHFFQQNLLEYMGATIYEVILADKYLAMEIFYALEEGDLNFADVAHQYIADPELNRRGGYLGTLKRKQLRPEISAAVFAATPPQLIEPVVTTVGIHLIHVEEIIQPQLDSLLHQRILMEMFDRWLAQQIAIVSPQTPLAKPLATRIEL
jgi:parvulin-like peptidyl-prolyl isomerase